MIPRLTKITSSTSPGIIKKLTILIIPDNTVERGFKTYQHMSGSEDEFMIWDDLCWKWYIKNHHGDRIYFDLRYDQIYTIEVIENSLDFILDTSSEDEASH